MDKTNHTIAKMRRYSCDSDDYQVTACADIRTLLDEIDRLREILSEYGEESDWLEELRYSQDRI